MSFFNRKNKSKFNDYDKEMMLFIIDMYLTYGDSLDIYPNGEAKDILINKINELKYKIENYNI